MINKIVLQSLIDPENPTKALEYLKQNMTEKEYLDWLTKRIIKQKDNEVIKLPLTIMFVVFMDYIQDVCEEPYRIYEDCLYDNVLDLPKETNLNNEKWNIEFFMSFVNEILNKNNGSAKKIKFTSNLYTPKDKPIEDKIIYPDKLVGIDNFVFAKE